MLFKSKLEHEDPAIRCEHVGQLSVDDDQLLQVAQSDPHPEVRATAVTRITDLPFVNRLSQKDSEERVRTMATARLQSLMAGSEVPAPALESRIAFLQSSTDLRLIRFIAVSAKEPELRKIAVEKLLSYQDQPEVLDTLCDVAGQDGVSEVRELAAKPIHDPARLQTLAEKSRTKDKNIHRLARERLEIIDKDAKAREILDQCCLEAEQLAAAEFSSDGKAEAGRMAVLTRQWQDNLAAITQPDKILAGRFAASTARIEKALKERKFQQDQRNEVLKQLSVLRDTPDATQLKLLSQRWHELDEAPPTEEKQFDQLLSEITRHASELERDEHRLIAMRALLKSMQDNLESGISEASLHRFEKRWDSGKTPADEKINNELQLEFKSLKEKAKHRLEQQARNLKDRIDNASTVLKQFEQAVEGGKLKEADAAHHKVGKLLAELEAPDQLKQKLTGRLRAGEAKFSELRRWRHWGTEQKRDELIAEAKQLAAGNGKIDAIAKSVRNIREQWKSLDRSDGPASKKKWQQFDTACEKAYEPCEQHFKEQKAKRADNMQGRIALCEKLESLKGEAEAASDWRKLSDNLREIQKEWRVAGAVDRRDRSKIQKRYDLAVAAIEKPLEEQRQQEVARRESLISSVEALAESEDIRKAVDTAKAAQRDWKPVVQASRRKEQDLWNRFRAACDVVFAKRKEHFAAADNQRAQNLGEKLAVCGQLEQMAIELKEKLQSEQMDKEAIRSCNGKVRELQNGWRRIGPIPRDKQEKTERKFRENCESVTRLCRQAEQKITEQAQQNFREASILCDELELAVASGNSIQTEPVEQLRQLLDSLPNTHKIDVRVKDLLKAANGDVDYISKIKKSMDNNLETKSTICLELEIAANIDSPAEFQEERMQYRVKQLTKAMSGVHKQLGPTELKQQWYQTGPVPKSHQAEIESRFKRAVEALSND